MEGIGAQVMEQFEDFIEQFSSEPPAHDTSSTTDGVLRDYIEQVRCCLSYPRPSPHVTPHCALAITVQADEERRPKHYLC